MSATRIHWLGAVVLMSLAGTAMPLAAQSLASNRSTPAAAPAVNALRPGDMIRVTVWPKPELGGEFTVEESGNVYLPMLGKVPTSNISLEQLRTRLRQGYGEMMKDPVVTITPVFRVGVLGAVERPGLYMVSPTHSLFDVLGMAGGFRPEANEKDVRIVREGQVVKVNALNALQKGQGLSALALRSGDQVVVRPKGGFQLSDARNVLIVIQAIALTVTLADRLGN